MNDKAAPAGKPEGMPPRLKTTKHMQRAFGRPGAWKGTVYLKSYVDAGFDRDSDTEYLSKIEHEALLRDAVAEARAEGEMDNTWKLSAEAWESAAREWMADYDKLKEKYEPMIVVTSDNKPARNEGADCAGEKAPISIWRAKNPAAKDIFDPVAFYRDSAPPPDTRGWVEYHHTGDCAKAWNRLEAELAETKARLAVAEKALQAVLNSDMAQREEDEGRVSDQLDNVREALKEISGTGEGGES